MLKKNILLSLTLLFAGFTGITNAMDKNKGLKEVILEGIDKYDSKTVLRKTSTIAKNDLNDDDWVELHRRAKNTHYTIFKEQKPLYYLSNCTLLTTFAASLCRLLQNNDTKQSLISGAVALVSFGLFSRPWACDRAKDNVECIEVRAANLGLKHLLEPKKEQPVTEQKSS